MVGGGRSPQLPDVIARLASRHLDVSFEFYSQIPHCSPAALSIEGWEPGAEDSCMGSASLSGEMEWQQRLFWRMATMGTTHSPHWNLDQAEWGQPRLSHLPPMGNGSCCLHWGLGTRERGGMTTGDAHVVVRDQGATPWSPHTSFQWGVAGISACQSPNSPSRSALSSPPQGPGVIRGGP